MIELQHALAELDVEPIEVISGTLTLTEQEQGLDGVNVGDRTMEIDKLLPEMGGTCSCGGLCCSCTGACGGCCHCK
jgi:hypothetical protein